MNKNIKKILTEIIDIISGGIILTSIIIITIPILLFFIILRIIVIILGIKPKQHKCEMCDNISTHKVRWYADCGGFGNIGSNYYCDEHFMGTKPRL
jgi:hypothetical protein